jgi:hypothetical protein
VKLSLHTRRWLLLLALPVAAFAALQANEAEVPVGRDRSSSQASASAPRAGSTEEPLPRLEIGRLEKLARRHASEQAPIDPFAAKVPEPSRQAHAAAPAAAPPPPPPPPQAPPVPFRFIGRQEASGVQVVFLEQQDQVHIVRIGEEVAEGWRLDAADDQTLTFTFLPLGQRRQLPIGSAG